MTGPMQWCTSDWCAGMNSQSLAQLVLLWMAGAIIGWLLPRPKQGSQAWTQTVWGQRLFSVFSGTAWRRMTITLHALVIMREVWYHFTGGPGTFRRLFAAVVSSLTGKKWSFDFSTGAVPGPIERTPCEPKLSESKEQEILEQSWYVNEKDLDLFKRSVGTDSGDAGPWELMMDREIAGIIKYTAWRRTMANGKTEYKSTTLCPDVTSEEYMDMYFDDDNRPTWDTMIINHEVLEYGDFSQRQQVVRWIRRFPFSFISDREYVIAKRVFREGDSLYGITKAVEHPRAPVNPEVVRMDVFYSMWSSRTVQCPWNSGAPACETTLLHHEQFKIPENLARFAVKHGMWGFVRKLSSETPKFVELRRQRCSPELPDSQAFGSGYKPNPPCLDSTCSPVKTPCGMRRTNTSTSILSSITTHSSVEAADSDVMYRASTGGSLSRNRSGKLRGMAAFAIASSLAMLLHRSASSERLPVSSSKMRRVSSMTSKKLRRTRTQSCFFENGKDQMEGL